MDLNDTVTVTLTKRGAEILNRRIIYNHERYGFTGTMTIVKEGDYSCMLWQLIVIFGDSSRLGEDAPFTNLRKA